MVNATGPSVSLGQYLHNIALMVSHVSHRESFLLGVFNCALSYSPHHPNASTTILHPINPTTSHQSSILRLTLERSPIVNTDATEYRADEIVKLSTTMVGNKRNSGTLEVDDCGGGGRRSGAMSFSDLTIVMIL